MIALSVTDYQGQAFESANAAVTGEGQQQIWATTDNANWAKDSSVTGIHYWGDGVDVYAFADYTFTWNSGSNFVYYRFSIPATGIDGMQFVRYNPEKTDKWSYTANITGILPANVYYIWDSNDDWNFQTSRGTIKASTLALEEVVRSAIEGVLTCYSNSTNGCGLYSSLNSNFYSILTDDQKNSFSSLALTDYSYEQYAANGKSYSGLTPSGSTTCGEKWSAIKATATSNTNSTSFVNASGYEAIVIPSICIGGLALLGLFAFVMKKRKA